ncbi:flagellar type III secretion system pore protein FliP [Imbroritus primus]|uniref:flagellar type III secretion system pore protein FliP n=1 Tax=Imbroritus primus TaxID=3058603 RepID=UPI003D160DA4
MMSLFSRRALPCAAALLALGSATPALAQTGLPVLTAGANGQSYTLSIQTLLFLTSLSFLPAVLLMMSGFTRIIIVLSLLRHALGTQTTPPNQVLIGLALFLTMFVMTPVLDRVHKEAYTPLAENRISFEQALETAAVPVREFMMKQTREPDIALFARLANLPPVEGPEAIPMRVLIPAFVTSELKTAFQIGFAIFIPFLVIDIVVASVLMSMGMMMVSPAIFSLPFKIMLFVMIDGWHLLLGSLSQSFTQ